MVIGYFILNVIFVYFKIYIRCHYFYSASMKIDLCQLQYMLPKIELFDLYMLYGGTAPFNDFQNFSVDISWGILCK